MVAVLFWLYLFLTSHVLENLEVRKLGAETGLTMKRLGPAARLRLIRPTSLRSCQVPLGGQ